MNNYYFEEDFFWYIENRRYEDALSGELDDTAWVSEDRGIDICLEDEPF